MRLNSLDNFVDALSLDGLTPPVNLFRRDAIIIVRGVFTKFFCKVTLMRWERLH